MTVDDHADSKSVSLIITTYNHAHFLREAIDSGRSQTSPPTEIIVIDDGSSDDPMSITADYADVITIRTQNQGLAAARNVGLGASVGDFIVFLDADDRLLPNAIQDGLAAAARNPEAAFVYGAHRRVDEDGQPIGGITYRAPIDEPFGGLLRGNLVGMHATVLYRRRELVAAGGFDSSLQRCEDYDVYLRLGREMPFAGHPAVVADYRQHGSNMTRDHAAMCKTALAVHRRARNGAAQADGLEAWHAGAVAWKHFYADQALQMGGRSSLARWRSAADISAKFVFHRAWTEIVRKMGRFLRRLAFVAKGRRGAGPPPIGVIRMGDLETTTPVSEDFGWDRGEPIDRYYLDQFMARHASKIRGRALEIGDDSYCRQYGGGRISHQDILHRKPTPTATIVGDISESGTLPASTFDVIVFTQTLHLIYDMKAAIACLRQALRPGGSLIVTVPGITPVDRKEWRETWYWSLTEFSLSRLISDEFPGDELDVETFGNVYSATSFLQGLAVQDVRKAMLDRRDMAFPVLVCAAITRTS
jgi:glycosyltransferase involved in cell wall biosynthesis